TPRLTWGYDFLKNHSKNVGIHVHFTILRVQMKNYTVYLKKNVFQSWENVHTQSATVRGGNQLLFAGKQCIKWQ
ncbi:hypothetical protein, partial [Fournierella sp.]|uniref:hypothetical protein n=1 Tax=Allofournierella sp. TaxID=1940256 RepID=UPI0025C1CAA7